MEERFAVAGLANQGKPTGISEGNRRLLSPYFTYKTKNETGEEQAKNKRNHSFGD
ncbi:hypothetical protein GCM10027347_54510 [Larkinella harenae]